jgi:hypothetical protein
LLIANVKGCNRVPEPPAKIIPFIISLIYFFVYYA